MSYSNTAFVQLMFGRSFCINSVLIFNEGHSVIQAKFLDGGTSNKVPKAGRANNPLQNDCQESEGKEGKKVRINGSACRVFLTLRSPPYFI